MENFFYDGKFIVNIEDLIFELDLDESDINDLPDDWEITCEETTFEKAFVLDMDFVVNAILDKIEYSHEDRLPGNSSYFEERLEIAISNSMNIGVLNYYIPSLYYPNGKFFKITKNDLIL